MFSLFLRCCRPVFVTSPALPSYFKSTGGLDHIRKAGKASVAGWAAVSEAGSMSYCGYGAGGYGREACGACEECEVRERCAMVAEREESAVGGAVAGQDRGEGDDHRDGGRSGGDPRGRSVAVWVTQSPPVDPGVRGWKEVDHAQTWVGRGWTEAARDWIAAGRDSTGAG